MRRMLAKGGRFQIYSSCYHETRMLTTKARRSGAQPTTTKELTLDALFHVFECTHAQLLSDFRHGNRAIKRSSSLHTLVKTPMICKELKARCNTNQLIRWIMWYERFALNGSCRQSPLVITEWTTLPVYSGLHDVELDTNERLHAHYSNSKYYALQQFAQTTAPSLRTLDCVAETHRASTGLQIVSSVFFNMFMQYSAFQIEIAPSNKSFRFEVPVTTSIGNVVLGKHSIELTWDSDRLWSVPRKVEMMIRLYSVFLNALCEHYRSHHKWNLARCASCNVSIPTAVVSIPSCHSASSTRTPSMTIIYTVLLPIVSKLVQLLRSEQSNTNDELLYWTTLAAVAACTFVHKYNSFSERVDVNCVVQLAIEYSKSSLAMQTTHFCCSIGCMQRTRNWQCFRLDDLRLRSQKRNQGLGQHRLDSVQRVYHSLSEAEDRNQRLHRCFATLKGVPSGAINTMVAMFNLDTMLVYASFRVCEARNPCQLPGGYAAWRSIHSCSVKNALLFIRTRSKHLAKQSAASYIVTHRHTHHPLLQWVNVHLSELHTGKRCHRLSMC